MPYGVVLTTEIGEAPNRGQLHEYTNDFVGQIESIVDSVLLQVVLLTSNSICLARVNVDRHRDRQQKD
jgi:hypothetical protein